MPAAFLFALAEYGNGRRFEPDSRYGLAHDSLVLTPIKAYADVSSRVGGLKFSPSLSIHLYVVYASCEGSGESVHKHRLARGFAARQRGKCMYQNLICWFP